MILRHEANQRRNKLTSICDELFPELTKIFHDPNLPFALALRERFPTPAAVATASLSELREIRLRKNFPSEAQLLSLQQLAQDSIGTKDTDRQRSLLFEQKQLIQELQLIRKHLAQLEEEIKSIVSTCREGQILLSIPPIGVVQAATIIASVGTIANFEKASELKSYFGWAPQVEQTGISADHSKLSKRGTRTMKQMLYLMAMRGVQGKSEWAMIYRDLVPRMCSYDDKLKDYRGKLKPLGRIAGQMASMIFALLKTDQETLSQVALGQDPPPPMLYDPEVHHRHRSGQYRSLKPGTLPRKIIQLPKRSDILL